MLAKMQEDMALSRTGKLKIFKDFIPLALTEEELQICS